MNTHFDTPDTLTTTSIVALFDTTKEDRQSFVIDFLDRIENGEINPLQAHAQVKSMEDVIAMLTDKKKYSGTASKYMGYVMSEAEKQSGKSFQMFNATFEKKEVGSVYNYENCNDAVLVELLQKQEKLKEAIIKRQELLKAAPVTGLHIVNEETGEAYTVYPPSKSSTSSIAVKLK